MIRQGRREIFALLLLGGAAACGEGQNPDLLARADQEELTVDQAVEIMADQARDSVTGQPLLPNRPEVVRAVADLWVDYILLAQAVMVDSTLASVDFMPLVRREMEQEMVYRLRDQVIQVDTVVSDEELERLWQGAGPDGEVWARHILLSLPQNAAQPQRDSVVALANELRERALGGERFEDLARDYSQDPGSARSGGDLGSLTRGSMVASFEEAAFALQPGEISGPVETIYGIHLIRVDSMDVESFEDPTRRSQFLLEVRAARFQAAESLYVAGVEEPANVQVRPEVFGALRELSERPGQRLSRRAAGRPVASYEGGAFTVGEFQEFIQSQQPAFRSQVAQGDSISLDYMVRSLTRAELLVNEAREAGLGLTDAQTDSLAESARNRLSVAATQLGLANIEPAEGQTDAEAVRQRVRDNLREILHGQRDVIPLGVISYTLRQQYDGEVFEAGVEAVVSALGSGTARVPSTPSGRAPNAPRPTGSEGSGNDG